MDAPHDNAPSHSSFLVRDFLAKHATTVLPQPPYSTVLTPADFFLFPKLKTTLKSHRFESIEAIKTNSLARLRSLENFYAIYSGIFPTHLVYSIADTNMAT